jgi:hypothetical protein
MFTFPPGKAGLITKAWHTALFPPRSGPQAYNFREWGRELTCGSLFLAALVSVLLVEFSVANAHTKE